MPEDTGIEKPSVLCALCVSVVRKRILLSAEPFLPKKILNREFGACLRESCTRFVTE